MATLAFVLGIVGLVLSFVIIGLFPAIVGVVVSVITLKNGKNGLAMAGLICSIVAIVISLIVFKAAPSNESGSTSGTVEDTIENVNQTENEVNQEDDSANIVDRMKVETYSCSSGSYLIAAFLITNTSDEDVRISMNVTAKDENGNALASASPEVYTVAAGTPAILAAYLDDVESDARIDYTLDVSTDVRSPSAAADVDLDYNINGDKIVLTATNHGTETAYFVNPAVIFLKDNQMVGYGETYLTGDNSDLKVGETRSGEIDCYSENGFDDVIVAFTAEQ